LVHDFDPFNRLAVHTQYVRLRLKVFFEQIGYGNVEGQEPALSLGYDIQDYGHVYLTAYGMAWLAEQMGYIRITKHEEKMLESTSKLVQANERIAELEEQLNQLPMGVERIMNGLRDLSVSAVADLGGLARPKRDNDGEADSGSPVSVSEATGATGATGPTGPTGATGATGPGVQAGGTAGQILTKNSSTDYDTVWAAPGAASYTTVVKQLIRNSTGSAMTKGQVVYVSGANGTNVLVSLSDADTEATSSKTLGFLEQNLANNADGYVICEGLLDNVDTASATAGQSVWLSSTAGGYVFGAPPAEPAHSVYLGVVIRANANNGQILVKVQNGYELDELHDVSAGSPSNGDLIIYNSSTGLWTKAAQSALSITKSQVSDFPVYGTTAGTITQGNDSRLSDARTPTTHASTHASGGSDPVTLAQSQVTNLTTDLAAKAPLASPTFTGTPAAPTASSGTSTTQLATTAFVQGAIPANYGYKSGYYYDTKNAGVGSGSAVLSANNDLCFHPYCVTSATTIQSLSINVTSAAGQSSTVVRLGIYADNGSGSPGSLVLDAGTVQVNSTGTKTITVSQALAKGVYWFAAWSSRASGGVQSVSLYNDSGAKADSSIGQIADTYSTSSAPLGYVLNTTYGSFPSTFPTGTWSESNSSVRIKFRTS